VSVLTPVVEKWEYPLQPSPSACQVPGGKSKSSTPGARTYFHPPSSTCLALRGETESLSLLSLDPAWLIQALQGGRLFIDFSEPSCHDMTMTMTWLTCMHWHRHRRHQEPCETECSCLPFALPHVVFGLLYSSSSLSIIYFSPRFSLHAQEDSNRGLSRHRGFSVRRAGIRAMVPIF
jgi:hypothetical protein